MLTPYLPYPPSSGGQIRSYNLIKQLSKKHQITLYSLIKYEKETEYVGELERYCQNVRVFKRPERPWTLQNILKTCFSLNPFLVIRNFSSEEKRSVADILKKEEFDIIHAETFYVSPHIPNTAVPVVLVDQTIEYQVYQHYVETFKWWFLKPLLWLDVLKIKYWETYYWRKAARAVAVSESDAKKMRVSSPTMNVSVVPNGVGEDLMEEVPLHFSQNILFMANYDWMQNIEAAKILVTQLFPAILKEIPQAKLLIAGQHIEKIANLKAENVRLVDLKIEDIKGVKKAYQESGILVAPLYGPGGSRLKILGAMGAKLPVVTTNIGIEGIDALDGQSVLVGRTPEELSTLAIRLLQNKDLYKKLALNARKLVEEKYSYQAIAHKLDGIYTEVKNGS
ncbi:MAG: Glycosyl transferase group 1 [Candidatus Daviesbacteria bacterium GW2011_GWA1_41_61]|uniref:Glycosyl transferase group 1 n=1 Tax=Candidatus Daviesbacteria bacterium GW2011_GWA2_40_9 TaxID=1618424 RepID=A0A0G0WFC6_9BACT|nr:MAG: Glycosyl transferase group 1 [Candidatus Daviesbacteria bacterium GW2011_GWC1_40_9]KKR83000.1 MAG: Glycosyl transferase group 1 [Candidatus Daviesbacteria bacterium GW2011_GWA2_40_9]KKR92926.1 MAG: Glycosyl transferase group 1 [Candidatus Daviesbacteria bacterium GW2011_GWB1_41_15]KKS15470.1 MAG: Glycosyl transferase group 1 [Candidatus Daviesbacteria bacterium GW2011_GWA1_41_61]